MNEVVMAAGAVPVLRVEGLGVSYGALTALDDVSWQVGAGELLGIIGPLAHGGSARALLLDEPGAGLGGADMEALVEMLHALKRERLALVVIEHHMDLIMAVADRIVVLDQGRCIASGTPREIQQHPAVLEAYLGRTE